MRGSRKTSIYLFFFGIVILVIGIYMNFFEGRGYIETTAVIDHIDETYSGGDNDTEYDVYVNYTVDGKDYQSRSDYYSPSYKEGKEIKIYYNPDNPQQIHGDSKGFRIYILVVGVVILVVSVLAFLRS